MANGDVLQKVAGHQTFAPTPAHGHVEGDVTALTSDLASKAGASHNHDSAYDAIGAASAAIKGLDFKQAVKAATTGALPAYTGALTTLTEVGFGAFPAIDGVSVNVGDRILVKDETAGNAINNGIYTLTAAGSGAASWVLMRATDANTSALLAPGSTVLVEDGTANTGIAFALSGDTVVLGTTSLLFVKVQAQALPHADALHTTHPTHAQIGSVGANDHHAEIHSIIGGDHSAFPGGTTSFLRADGTFAAPSAALPPELESNATYGDVWFNVLAYGADPTGATDSTAAIQAAINAVRSTGSDVKGGVVFFPPGVYRCDGTIDLSWSAGTQRGAIVLQGAGTLGTAGGGSIYPTSTLKYTASGTGRFIDARHSQALTFRDLGITYSSTTFTGYLVDLENPGATGSDSQYAYFERCLFYSWQGASNSCARLLNAGNAIFVTCISCHFGGAQVGIGGNRGGGPPDNPTGPACYYSNAVRILSCTFDSLVYAMQNPYQAWYVDGCWFEMNVQAPMNNPMVSVWQFTSDNPSPFVYASTLTGSWIGDPGGSITKNIIDFSNVTVAGCVISGNMLAGDNTFTTCIKLPVNVAGVGNIHGLAVIGNWFTGAFRGIYLPSGAGTNILGMHVQNNNFAVVSGSELVGSFFGASTLSVVGNTGLADQIFGGSLQYLGQSIQFKKGDNTPMMAMERDPSSASIYLKWEDASLEQTTVGAAGTAAALPANPTKYFIVKDHSGTKLIIPAYAAS